MADTGIIVSAPGKVILHGEHAVVYGKPALATSVDLRCYLVLKETKDGKVSLYLPDFDNHHAQWKLSHFFNMHTKPNVFMERVKELTYIQSDLPDNLNTAMQVFLYLLVHICGEKLKDFGGISAIVISTLPAGAGLGSSAAFSVSLAAGFLTLIKRLSTNRASRDPASGAEREENEEESVNMTLPESVIEKLKEMGENVSYVTRCSGWSEKDLKIINELGLKAEKFIHGTPSGIDNSISTYGGAIRFCSGTIDRIERMPKLRILLVNTKVPRSTKKMVAGVRDLHNKHSSVVGPMLDSIEAIVKKAETLLNELAQLSRPDSTEATTIHTSLQELCGLNHHLLNAIGVGHPALDNVCSLAHQRGLAAKLTGAGGGGCAFILLPPDYPGSNLAEVMEVLSNAGYESWETTIGSIGVTSHSSHKTLS